MGIYSRAQIPLKATLICKCYVCYKDTYINEQIVIYL